MNNKKLIFDIGSNIGDFTNKCLETYEGCKVISIEPNDELIAHLKNRFHNENVEILGFLVSGKSGELVDFYIGNVDTISTASVDWVEKSRFISTNSWSSPIKKETISLDDLIKKYGSPELIKIDVEGYEYDVIIGLSSKQNKICFEWAEEQYEAINKTCKYLESIGYLDFGFTYGDQFLLEPEKWTTWKDCDIHLDIDINRKNKWGMIWVR